jgi:uncharacterized cupin superfamily protein
MAEPNLHDPSWDFDMPEPPFAGRAAQLGAQAGSRELGATLYELDPGGAISPYHAHYGNEELLFVLAGSPALRTPEGTRRLEPGAVAAFPRGADGAHQVTNPGDERARVLMISTMNFPEVAEHLDTGTTLAVTGPAGGKAFPAGADEPLLDLVLKALKG